jgi:large subunit ribosomal protein L22
MPVTQRSPALSSPNQFSLNLVSMIPATPCEAVENTRFPLKQDSEIPQKTVKATRKYLRTSVKKLWPLIHPLKNLHVEDALNTLEAIRRKPSEWVQNIIKAGIRSAVNIKEMHEDRLYIKHFILGKNKGIKGIRRHAKSKMGKMLRPKSQVTVVIVEKTVPEFYQIITDGKFSPAIASILRMMLLNSNASLQDIQMFQHYLTAKGRQQNKLMFKRKVFLYVEEKKKQGIIISSEYAKEILLKEEAARFEEDYWKYKRFEVENKIAERLEIFKKNQKSR